MEDLSLLDSSQPASTYLGQVEAAPTLTSQLLQALRPPGGPLARPARTDNQLHRQCADRSVSQAFNREKSPEKISSTDRLKRLSYVSRAARNLASARQGLQDRPARVALAPCALSPHGAGIQQMNCLDCHSHSTLQHPSLVSRFFKLSCWDSQNCWRLFLLGRTVLASSFLCSVASRDLAVSTF